MPRKKPRDLEDLTEPAKKVVLLLRSGERLCKTIHLRERGGDTSFEFHLEPSGRRVTEGTARRVLKSDYVTPMGDGLLGSDSSQTWAAK